jgi:hypothetical protein
LSLLGKNDEKIIWLKVMRKEAGEMHATRSLKMYSLFYI